MNALLPAGPFPALHPNVALLHFGHEPFLGTGVFTVRRGRSVLSWATARAVRLPVAARAVPMTLLVTREGETELWQRTFGTRRLDAHFVRAGTGIVECFGPLRLAYRMEETRGALVLRLTATSASLFGLILPVPQWLSPKVRARTYGLNDGRIRACIVVFAPWGTLLLAYHGWVTEVHA